MSKRLTAKEAAHLLTELTSSAKPRVPPYTWKISKDADNTDALQTRFKFKSFEDTWAFLTKVALRSHLMGHHPKITTVYNVVDLELTTHDVGGLSDKDFKMASRFSKYTKNIGESSSE